jgi:hypothetical protein
MTMAGWAREGQGFRPAGGVAPKSREMVDSMPALASNGKLILFIHVPKTGGSSVEAVMAGHGPLLLADRRNGRARPCSPVHYHAALLLEKLQPEAIAYSCMLVRHPLDRMVSEYRYTTRKPGRWRRLLSFPQWLRFAAAAHRLNPYYRDNHLRPQIEFALPGTEVFHYEAGVERCAAAILARLGHPEPAAVPHLKAAAKKPPKVTRRDAEFVRELYDGDYAAFAYDTWPRNWPAEGA